MVNDLPSNIFIAKSKKFVIGFPNSALAFFWKNKTPFLIGLFAMLIFIALGTSAKGAIMAIILTIIASFSTYYKRYVKFTMGFELVTLATVLTTVAYGPLIGALVGFVSATAAEVIPQMIDPSSFFWILSLIVSAFAVAFFHGMGVPLFWLGFVSLTIQFIMTEPIRFFSGDSYLKTMSIVNIVTTTAWTVLWFKVVAPILIGIM